VGLLAILKAGGGYVPLDPGYPAERLSYMVQDSQPVVILQDEAGKKALGEHGAKAKLIDIGQPAPWAK
jgi:non-ribosomal peptide synthetase component F